MDENWEEDIELIIIRTAGNYTEAQFAIQECNDMANFLKQMGVLY